MIRVCVVDDDPVSTQCLLRMIERYREESAEGISVTVLTDGAQLIDTYRSDVDILLLDIDMPGLDGFSAARVIRDIDKQVVIVFVTNLLHYAVRGYEVGALSYLVKPLKYFAFAQQLRRSIIEVRRRGVGRVLALPIDTGLVRVPMDEVVFIETGHRRSIVHVMDGRYEVSRTLKQLEEDVAEGPFFRSNNCYVVNLDHVREVQRNLCLMTTGERLAVSRPRKRAFLEALTDHLALAHASAFARGDTRVRPSRPSEPAMP